MFPWKRVVWELKKYVLELVKNTFQEQYILELFKNGKVQEQDILELFKNSF